MREIKTNRGLFNFSSAHFAIFWISNNCWISKQQQWSQGNCQQLVEFFIVSYFSGGMIVRPPSPFLLRTNSRPLSQCLLPHVGSISSRCPFISDKKKPQKTSTDSHVLDASDFLRKEIQELSVKDSSHKSKGPTSDLQHSHEKLSVTACICHPRPRAAEAGGSLKLSSQPVWPNDEFKVLWETLPQTVRWGLAEEDTGSNI